MLHPLPFTNFGEIATLGLEVHVTCSRCHNPRRIMLDDGRLLARAGRSGQVERAWPVPQPPLSAGRGLRSPRRASYYGYSEASAGRGTTSLFPEKLPNAR